MKRWLFLAGALVLLAAQGAYRVRLQESQEAAELVVASAGLDGLSADVAVPALALGAFRGLTADYLWLRSLALRDQGRHYEARQLAEQICRLQPRLAEVWSYLGHDLAYNLTASESTPEARWRWIQNGIELLRDEGLRLNPEVPSLYTMLARIFHDKIGGSFDDFHMVYKRTHAEGMLFTIGELDAEELAAIPELEALRAQRPEVEALIAQGRAVGLELSEEGLELEWTLRQLEIARAQGQEPPGPPEAVARFLAERRAGEPYQALIRSLRIAALRRRYRIDPRRLLEVDRAWGPLDWRSSDAQTVYWATEGIRSAQARGDVREELRLRRLAMQGVKAAMRRGRITLLPNGDLFLAPVVEMVGRLDQLYGEARARGEALLEEIARGRHDRGVEGLVDGFLTNQVSAREDFLGEAIILLAQYGRETDARRLLARAAEAYPRNAMFQASYDDYLMTALASRYADAGTFDTQVGMSQLIEGTWTTAFKMLALGQDARYRSLERLARASRARWERFLARQEADDPHVRQRLGIPYRDIRRRAVWRAAQAVPPGLRGILAERIPGVTRAMLETPPPQMTAPPPRGGGS